MNNFGKSLLGVVRSAGLVGLIACSTPSFATDDLPSVTVRPSDRLREPFQAAWTVPYDDPSDGEILVPEGKRLVIEFVSLDIGIDSDCRVASLSVATKTGGTAVGFHVPTTARFEGVNRSVDMLGQMVVLRSDPGTKADVNYGVIGLSCNQIGVISVSGYFEPALPTLPQ